MNRRSCPDKYRLLTPDLKRTKALEKASQPLFPFISRRKFMVASAIGAVTVTISPLSSTLIVNAAEPLPPFKWKSFLGFAGIAATIMGYGPILALFSDFISAVKAKDPEKAAKIVGETGLLKGKGYLDPSQVIGATSDWNPFQTADGKIGLPFLHKDGLNGIVSYLIGSGVLARLAGTTQAAIPGASTSLEGNFGFSAADLVGIFSPKEQISASFGKFDKTDKNPDKYKSQVDAVLRFFNTNTGNGTSQNSFVVEDARDPTSGKKIHIEDKIDVRYVV